MSGYKRWAIFLVCVLMFFSVAIKNVTIFKNIDMSGVSYSASQEIEVTSEFLGVNYPCEILSFYENEEGYIVIKTNPQSFIVAPLTIVCDYASRDNMRGIHFKKLGFDCYFYGFENIAIVEGVECKSGVVLGSLSGDKLFVRVYKNENRVSLKTISRLF